MKDYSKYFKGPSLKDARSRGRTEVQHLDDAFEIPADMVGIGKGQTYYIQTYGCQANERDTETLSGILEMMGYTHTDEVKQADVVLLNTCAIRENAEESFQNVLDLEFQNRIALIILEHMNKEDYWQLFKETGKIEYKLCT